MRYQYVSKIEHYGIKSTSELFVASKLNNPPPKLIVQNNFSIVTAAYNVARYLDDFFESLVNQTISFTRNMEIVIVDDGSSDDTAAKILEWVDKYPRNIRYLWQENAGQGAARNHGLSYAKHEWVTFIDPDDFISERYFEHADSIIEENKKNRPLKLICASLIFYYEDKDKISDTHPLRFRFAKGDVVLPVNTPGKHLNLNVTSNIFKRERILQYSLQFDHRIKPGFEDSHFINSYLLTISDGYMAYLKSAEYYYRKRDDGTSTLDTGWQHPGRYDHQLRLGSLGIIKKSLEKNEKIPEYIQRVALYDLSWHLNKIIKKDADIYSLSNEKLELYKSLIHEIFTHISVETIMSFELAGVWFYHKLGLLSFFKGYSPAFNICYIDQVDQVKDLVRIRYFYSSDDVQESFAWDGEATFPLYAKTRVHDFFGERFLNERIVWLRIGDTNTLSIETCNKPTRITLKGKQFRTGVSTADIRAAFKPAIIDESVLDPEIVRIRHLSQTVQAATQYGGSWLFMDRDNFADDNAEHLYRYVKNHLPRQKIYFVLDPSSTDWPRLTREGFNLVELNSDDHKAALINAEHFISSHADQYIFAGIDKRNYGDLISYKFTFLQHGVISCDLSHWLNTKEIDCFVTSTKPEFESIYKDGPYKFTKKETVLTGLPRLDNLYSIKNSCPNTVLIMPTWRNSLAGKLTGDGNAREYNPLFKDSLFCRSWSEVLNSDTVRKLSEKYEVIFYPHANIIQYIDDFAVPDHITVKTQFNTSIQSALANAEILITDYSSVAFDFAYLEKVVYYYQFDAAEVLSGGHTYRPGYFDFEKDGFGPVSSDFATLNSHLSEFSNHGNRSHQPYLTRIKNTFEKERQNNCKRVVDAIISLTRSSICSDDISYSLEQTIKQLQAESNTHDLITALRQAYAVSPDPDTKAIALAKAYRMAGDLENAAEWIAKVVKESPEAADQRVEIAIAGGDMSALNDDYFDLGNHSIEEYDDSHYELLLRYHIAKNNLDVVDSLITASSGRKSVSVQVLIAEGCMLLKRWDTALDHLLQAHAVKPKDISLKLMIVDANIRLGNSVDAWKYAANIPEHKIPEHHQLEFGRLAYSAGNWKQAEARLSPLASAGKLEADDYLKLAKAQRKASKLEAAEISLSLATLATDQRTVMQEKALLLTSMRRWPQAIEAWEQFLARKELKPNRDAWLHLATCRLELGQIKQSERDIERFEKMSGATPQSIKLRKLLATH